MSDRADWKVVENAPPPYAKCVLSGFSDGPFIDFGTRIAAIDPNVAVNIDVLKDAARFVGMVSPEEHAEVCEQLDAANAELVEAKAKLVQALATVDAIHVIKSAGFRPEKKRGPRPAGVAQ